MGSFSVSVPRVVASPDSKICPPGWMGIVAINDAVLITAAFPAAAHQLDCRLRALALVEVTDVSALHALLPIAEVLGPAWLSYLAQENLPMRHRPQAVERLPPGHGDLTRLRRLEIDPPRLSALAHVLTSNHADHRRFMHGIEVALIGMPVRSDADRHARIMCPRPCRRRGCSSGGGRGSCGPGHSAWWCGGRHAERRSGRLVDPLQRRAWW